MTSSMMNIVSVKFSTRQIKILVKLVCPSDDGLSILTTINDILLCIKMQTSGQDQPRLGTVSVFPSVMLSFFSVSTTESVCQTVSAILQYYVFSLADSVNCSICHWIWDNMALYSQLNSNPDHFVCQTYSWQNYFQESVCYCNC